LVTFKGIALSDEMLKKKIITDEFGIIKKINLNSKKIITLSIVEHPRALAVDWITDNVYVSSNGPNMIKVYFFSSQ